MSIIRDLNMKNNLRKVELCKSKVNFTNRIALCLRLQNTDTQVIIKEFNGSYSYRKWLFEAVLLRSLISPKAKELDKVNNILNGFVDFLEEKEKINNEKIS